jgi:uncharacterized protein
MTRTKYSLLALDGGGIRGVIPARVLDEIEQRTGRPISELFDLVAGTSTGGILALGLTKPVRRGSRAPAFSAANLLDLYLDHGAAIFPKPSIWKRMSNPFGLADVRYPCEPLEGLLEERFADAMLSEALIEVCIPSYDLSKPAAYFFKRQYARDEDQPWDRRMSLVARATSAAPTSFDPARLGDHALVDGGVFANNPAAAAYADALDLWGDQVEIQVISIGTGQPPQTMGRGPIPVPYERANGWGLGHWARPVIEVVFDGVAEAVEYQLKRLCRHHDGDRPRYHRMQSDLPTANHHMDDASPENLRRLIDDANTLIKAQGDTLTTICEVLGEVAVERDAARGPAPV